MIEHLNIIDALHSQTDALLDLMMCSEDGIDHQSIKTAAEMSQTMLDELYAEVGKIGDEWREQQDERV